MIVKCLGRVNVTTPGTPVALSTDPRAFASKLFFQAVPGLTGKTYIGNTSLKKSTWVGVTRVLAANSSSGMSENFFIEASDGEDSIRLMDYAIDADVAGEGLLITYWQS
jgi:hypothetical protein